MWGPTTVWNTKPWHPAAVILSAMLLQGCADPSRTLSAAGQGELILICDLKPGVKEAEVIPAANELRNLPGVIDVIATGGLVQNRGGEAGVGPTSDMSIAFLLTFRDGHGSGEGQAGARKVLTEHGYMNKLVRLTAYDGVAQNYFVSEEYIKQNTAADLERRSAAAKKLERQRSIAK